VEPMDFWIASAVGLVIAYLFGSTPTGYLAGKLLKGIDIRELPYRLLVIAGGIYVIVRHRANIQRLLAGTEPRLGRSGPDPKAEAQI
jgi:glycerol-3-phosphate acyltransferase PlsY